jgi:hypothetical protein
MNALHQNAGSFDDIVMALQLGAASDEILADISLH